MFRWIGAWQTVKVRLGGGLPDEHLKSMFLKVLPDKVSAELVRTPKLSTFQETIVDVLLDLRRLQDHSFAKIHEQRLTQSLNIGKPRPVMPPTH